MSTDIKREKIDVYKITGFSDIIASPVFYTILFLSFLLGLSSIFGFLQNPRKLKTVIDVIHHKTVISQKAPININKYSLFTGTESVNRDRDVLEKNDAFKSSTVSYLDNDRYNIFSDDFVFDYSESPSDVMKHISFNYDITSRRFWEDLDIGRISPAIQGINDNSLPLIIGIPVDSTLILEDDDSKYSMKGVKKYQI